MTYETEPTYGTTSRYSGDSWTDAPGWVVDTARRNPEALLVLAAGLALLMRGGGRMYRSSGSGGDYRRDPRRASDEEHVAELYRENQREHGGTVQSLRDSVGEAAREAGEYASDMAERVYESTSSYASSVSRYAEEQRRYLARRAYRMRDQAGEMLHEQPLAVAALGLVTGAAVAALLPPTRMEERTLSPARDRIWDAATRTAESLMGAAGETATRVREDAAERGLSKEGLKEMAREAGETFTSKVSGGGEKGGSTSGGAQGSGEARPGSNTSGAGGFAAGSGASRSTPRGGGGGTAGSRTGAAGKSGSAGASGVSGAGASPGAAGAGAGGSTSSSSSGTGVSGGGTSGSSGTGTAGSRAGAAGKGGPGGGSNQGGGAGR